MNWGRVVLCGLVAGGVWTLLSAALLVVVGGDFLAALPADRPPGGGARVFLRISNFVASVWAMWLYAAIRPRFGPGPKTAAVAGFAWWFIESLPSAKWVALLGLPTDVVLAPGAATLPAIIEAALMGAWFYEERRPTTG